MVGEANNFACLFAFVLFVLYMFLEVPRARPRRKTGGMDPEDPGQGQGPIGPPPVLGLGLALGTSRNNAKTSHEQTNMPNP